MSRFSGRKVASNRTRCAPTLSQRLRRRSIVDGSAQCRSSNTRSKGAVVARTANASPISRNMRSLVAPDVSWRSCSNSAAEQKVGSCRHQVGALARRMGHTESLRSRSMAVRASRNGRYASPVPYCSTARPVAMHTAGCSRRAERMNSAASADLRFRLHPSGRRLFPILPTFVRKYPAKRSISRRRPTKPCGAVNAVSEPARAVPVASVGAAVVTVATKR